MLIGYEALMRPYAASVCDLMLIGYEAFRCGVCAFKQLVYETLC